MRGQLTGLKALMDAIQTITSAQEDEKVVFESLVY